MKQLPRDDFGYINNRGRSKYWGVTVTNDDEWAVSYHPTDSDMTHSASAQDFKLSENDAANIAAKIYENNQSRVFTERTMRVLSLDKRWVFRIRGNTIYREKFANQQVTQNKPTLTLVDVVKETPRQHEKAVVNKAATSENEYVAKLAEMILSGNLSERSSKALIAVLESTIE